MRKYPIFFFSLFAALLNTPVLANPVPQLSIGSAPTPYGVSGCMQRAEMVLYRIGATGISPGSGSGSYFASHGSNTVGIWCRGPEAIIVVAGDNNAPTLRQEVRAGL